MTRRIVESEAQLADRFLYTDRDTVERFTFTKGSGSTDLVDGQTAFDGFVAEDLVDGQTAFEGFVTEFADFG